MFVLYFAQEMITGIWCRRVWSECSEYRVQTTIYVKQIGAGHDKLIQRFVQELSDTRLVIFDMLQKIWEAGADRDSDSND